MRGFDALCARGRPLARGSLQAVVGELESIVLGDAGTGGAPSLPLENVDYGPTPAQLQEVEKARAAKQAGYAQIMPKGGTPQTQKGGSFLVLPLWAGAPVKVWQAGLGALGVLLLMTGVASAVRLGRR